MLNKNDTVYLKSGIHTDTKFVGRVVSPGPEQSIVRWNNGNESCVINKWLVPVDKPEDDNDMPVIVPCRTTREMAGIDKPVVEPKPKKPKVDDDLVLDIKSRIGMDEARLKAFALLNGVWDDKYDALPNVGLRRMNCVNRLRAKIKKGHEVKWPK